MKKILIATGNEGKYKEMMETLWDCEIDLVSLAHMGLQNDLEETGKTFGENAFQKAKYFHEKTGLPVIAEDSGIIVDALVGELGIKTRRWGAGEYASDEEWMRVFLDRMQDETMRSARFYCAACFYNGIQKNIFEGSVEGNLLDKPVDPMPKGIPLSALFVPNGYDKVFSQMDPVEKNSISHRGKAMQQLKHFLSDFSQTMKTIYIGSDHGGFELKSELIEFISSQGYDVQDLGCNSAESVDYPEYGKKVATAVVEDEGSQGIVICGTGIGISIAANKVAGARCALCTTSTHAKLSQEHNNANVLALGARMTGVELAKDIVMAFLKTEFEGGRHERRVNAIEE